jgi:hypothetical protein
VFRDQGDEEDILATKRGNKKRLEKITYRGALCSAFLTKYSGNRIKNEMGGACGTYGGHDMCIKGFDRETRGKRSTSKTWLRCEYNIKADLRETGLEVVDLVNLAQDRGKWCVVVNNELSGSTKITEIS